jgi:hypothetical protein
LAQGQPVLLWRNWTAPTSYQPLQQGHLIGPHFFDGNVNNTAYLITLQKSFVLKLHEGGLKSTCILQQDGTPGNYVLSVRECLSSTFSGRWHDQVWETKSPDFTSCHNSLWGILKQKILQSHSYFTTGGLPPISSFRRQAPWDSRPVILFSKWTLAVVALI